MSRDRMGDGALERQIAFILRWGTLIGSAVIALGLLAPLDRPLGRWVVLAGIAAFIALPVVRVGLMARAYARARDYPLMTAAGFVLLFIALNAVAGLVLRR